MNEKILQTLSPSFIPHGAPSNCSYFNHWTGVYRQLCPATAIQLLLQLLIVLEVGSKLSYPAMVSAAMAAVDPAVWNGVRLI